MSSYGPGATGILIADGRVHRRTGPWTADVHELMAHVRANGVPEVPEVVEVPDVVAPVSTEPVAAVLVVPPTPAGQAAAPSVTPELVE